MDRVSGSSWLLLEEALVPSWKQGGAGAAMTELEQQVGPGPWLEARDAELHPAPAGTCGVPVAKVFSGPAPVQSPDVHGPAHSALLNQFP